MEARLEFRTLIDLFNKSLEKNISLDKKCLEIVRAKRRETLTFEQLRTRAQDFALWLIRAGGIRTGDRVAILGRNRADWDVALWGIILAGAVPVLIDPDRPVDGVKNHLVHTGVSLLVMADDYQDIDSRRQIREFASSRNIGLVEMAVYEKSCSDKAAADKLLGEISNKVKADDTAVILCTSGTTADPREVELTHAGIIANIQGSLGAVKITSEDTLGHILPPHHSFGLTVGKLLPFCVGAANVYTNKYRQISNLIRDKNITIFVAVPALFTVLAKNIEDGLAEQKQEKLYVRLFDRYLPKLLGKGIRKKQGWGKLRFFLSGSAPVPKWVLDVFWRRGLILYEGYGTTENSPVYGFNDNPQKLGSVGKPIATLSVRIVGEGNRVLPPGEKGEIVLGGPCIMKGYYSNPGSTGSAVQIDNRGIRWLYTGDLGYLDEDGYLFVTGRKKYVIVLPGGKNVNPELVESELSRARYVEEVLVVPDSRKDSAGIEREIVRVIVRPAWDVIETCTSFSYRDLVAQPQALKTLVWQSIDECQQKSRNLASFEKVSSRHLEIKIEEFQKTSTGKIKREAYIKL